jgi:hypothetical protein
MNWMRNDYKIVITKLEVKTTCRWEENVKRDLELYENRKI